MTSKDCGMKFELNQRVFIKTMDNKEGIVTGWFTRYDSLGTHKEYEVCYQDKLIWEAHYPSVKEYLGSRSCYIRAKEEDLESEIFNIIEQIKVTEEIRIAAIEISRGLDLDLCASYHNIFRLPNETDVELRIRILDSINKASIRVDIGTPDSIEAVRQKVSDAIKANCKHSWKTYTGFTDAFDYCEKCHCRKTE